MKMTQSSKQLNSEKHRWRSILYLHIHFWSLYNENLHTILHYYYYHQCYSSSLLTLTFLLNSISTTLNFINNIIKISVSHNNWMCLYYFFAWLLLHRFLGVYCTYLIIITSRRGWSIFCVGTIFVFCSGCCF